MSDRRGGTKRTVEYRQDEDQAALLAVLRDEPLEGFPWSSCNTTFEGVRDVLAASDEAFHRECIRVLAERCSKSDASASDVLVVICQWCPFLLKTARVLEALAMYNDTYGVMEKLLWRNAVPSEDFAISLCLDGNFPVLLLCIPYLSIPVSNVVWRRVARYADGRCLLALARRDERFMDGTHAIDRLVQCGLKNVLWRNDVLEVLSREHMFGRKSKQEAFGAKAFFNPDGDLRCVSVFCDAFSDLNVTVGMGGGTIWENAGISVPFPPDPIRTFLSLNNAELPDVQDQFYECPEFLWMLYRTGTITVQDLRRTPKELLPYIAQESQQGTTTVLHAMCADGNWPVIKYLLIHGGPSLHPFARNEDSLYPHELLPQSMCGDYMRFTQWRPDRVRTRWYGPYFLMRAKALLLVIQRLYPWVPRDIRMRLVSEVSKVEVVCI